jgi:hypothetical protein
MPCKGYLFRHVSNFYEQDEAVNSKQRESQALNSGKSGKWQLPESFNLGLRKRCEDKIRKKKNHRPLSNNSVRGRAAMNKSLANNIWG